MLKREDDYNVWTIVPMAHPDFIELKADGYREERYNIKNSNCNKATFKRLKNNKRYQEFILLIPFVHNVSL